MSEPEPTAGQVPATTEDAKATLLAQLRELLPSAFLDGELDKPALLAALDLDDTSLPAFAFTWPGIEQARQELNRLELEAHEDGFWNDLERSQKNQMRSKQLHNKIHRYEKLVSTRDDLLALQSIDRETKAPAKRLLITYRQLILMIW